MARAKAVGEAGGEFVVVGSHVPHPVQPPLADAHIGTVTGNEIDQHVPAGARLAEGEAVIESRQQVGADLGFGYRAAPGNVTGVAGLDPRLQRAPGG